MKSFLILVLWVWASAANASDLLRPKDATAISVKSSLGNCKATQTPPIKKAFAKSGELHFEFDIQSYCNLMENTTLKAFKKKNTIWVELIFKSNEVTRCSCPSKIQGHFPGLKPGTYETRFAFINAYAKSTKKLFKKRVELKSKPSNP